jgi:hypothetical protein
MLDRPTLIFGRVSILFAGLLLLSVSINDGLLGITECFKSLWKNSEKLYSQKHLANASCAVFFASWDTPFVVGKLIRSGQMALC